MREAGLGLGAAVVAVVCCAGLPLLVALVGGVTLAGLFGLIGVALGIGAIALAFLSRARRRDCAADKGSPPTVGKPRATE